MFSRRRFVATVPAAALLAQHSFAVPNVFVQQRAFIGTTGKDGGGIFVATFDEETGAFSTPELAAKFSGNDSMTLSPGSPHRLYATCTVDGSASVAGFNIVDGRSPLQQINVQTAQGSIPNYLSLDGSGRVAMEANWGSGSINTYLVDTSGALSLPVEHIEYGEADHGPAPTQPHSRCHSILVAPGTQFVLVNDYGADRIRIYRLDHATARLTPHDPPFWKAAPGSAPRHLVLHPNGTWIYNINELTNTVDLLLWDSKAGTLTLQSTVTTLPADAPPRCRAADIVLSPDNRFLYGSNRGLESFVTWSVQRDGSLQQIQFVKQDGVENRQLRLDATGRWLLAANVRSGDVAVFPRDAKTGLLGAQHSAVKLPGACFVVFG